MELHSIVVLIFVIGSACALDICVNISPHKDVNKNVVADIVEPASDNKECLSRCLILKQTNAMPCKAVAYAETKLPTTRGMCKMYSSDKTGNLLDLIDITTMDATYYTLVDQCTDQSQKISVDKDTGAVDFVTTSLALATTTTIPAPVVIVNPTPNPNSEAPRPELLFTPAGPGPVVDPTLTALTQMPITQAPLGGPGGSYLGSMWGPWNDWTFCSVTCGGSGQQTRVRQCVGANVGCMGDAQQMQQCQFGVQPCPATGLKKQAMFVPFRPFMPTAPPFQNFRMVN